MLNGHVYFRNLGGSWLPLPLNSGRSNCAPSFLQELTWTFFRNNDVHQCLHGSASKGAPIEAMQLTTLMTKWWQTWPMVSFQCIFCMAGGLLIELSMVISNFATWEGAGYLSPWTVGEVIVLPPFFKNSRGQFFATMTCINAFMAPHLRGRQ